MKILAVRDFRNQLASSLDSVDSGEHVFIRRKNKLYIIVPVEVDDLTITPELADKIGKKSNPRAFKTLFDLLQDFFKYT